MRTEVQPPSEENLVPFEAKCRFCGITLNCLVDPDGVAEQPAKHEIAIKADVLRSLAACNRCSDVRRMAWRVESAYKRNADKLMQSRLFGKETSVVGDVRAGFERTTKFWLAYLCKVYRISDMHDDSIVNTLVTKPAAYPSVVHMLRQMIEKAAREAWSTATQ
jgi:hypothetical protein